MSLLLQRPWTHACRPTVAASTHINAAQYSSTACGASGRCCAAHSERGAFPTHCYNFGSVLLHVMREAHVSVTAGGGPAWLVRAATLCGLSHTHTQQQWAVMQLGHVWPGLQFTGHACRGRGVHAGCALSPWACICVAGFAGSPSMPHSSCDQGWTAHTLCALLLSDPHVLPIHNCWSKQTPICFMTVLW